MRGFSTNSASTFYGQVELARSVDAASVDSRPRGVFAKSLVFESGSQGVYRFEGLYSLAASWYAEKVYEATFDSCFSALTGRCDPSMRESSSECFTSAGRVALLHTGTTRDDSHARKGCLDYGYIRPNGYTTPLGEDSYLCGSCMDQFTSDTSLVHMMVFGDWPNVLAFGAELPTVQLQITRNGSTDKKTVQPKKTH